jgi:hypothetical protein
MRQSFLWSVVVASLPLTAAAAPSQAPPADEYTPAKACAECHETIHQYWADSAHATSASNPAYLAALESAVADAADAASVRRECVWCHAPTALVSNDYGLEQAITREGVTCDFCHTVADVDMTRPGHPFELAPGPVKRGPLEFAASDFHATAYSVLHRSSALLCASCHEWRNARGVAVLSTWTEWLKSPYAARGQTCQECHMPMVPGDTVGEGLKSSERRVNLHRMQGGSAASKLRSGLGLDLEALNIGASSAQLQATVTNTGVGHAVPGGLGNDQLVLVVGIEAADGRLLHPQERVFQRLLRDARGRTLTQIPDLFLKAAAVAEDSRILPKQSRNERFTLPLPEGWKAIVARLEFRDMANPASEPILITEQRRGR